MLEVQLLTIGVGRELPFSGSWAGQKVGSLYMGVIKDPQRHA